MVLRGDRTTMQFDGAVRGDSFTGSFMEAGASGGFAYARSTATGESFTQDEVTFRNGAVHLAGTLLLPRGSTPVGAMVFLHGSGAEGRWASRFLAEQMANRGVAALIYDKRGVGASGGDWRTASPEEIARDAIAAVDFLSTHARIDPRRIGIHGHSQGGTLAPFVATHSPKVRVVVGSAAAGTPTDSTEIFSILNARGAQLTTAGDSADARAYVSELVAVAYHGRPRRLLDSMVVAYRARPWFFAPPAADASYWQFSRAFGRYEPLAWWRRVNVPVLLLYGGDDQRVPPAESAARIAEALLRAGNQDVTVRIFPGADHTFRLPPGPSGWPATAADYLETLLTWTQRRLENVSR